MKLTDHQYICCSRCCKRKVVEKLLELDQCDVVMKAFENDMDIRYKIHLCKTCVEEMSDMFKEDAKAVVT